MNTILIVDDNESIVNVLQAYVKKEGFDSITAFAFLIIVIIITVILIGILSFYYSKLITRPIKTMTAYAIEMSKGNYSVKTNIPQKDEIGQLSISLDLLASKHRR